jgi:hypothetical protein
MRDPRAFDHETNNIDRSGNFATVNGPHSARKVSLRTKGPTLLIKNSMRSANLSGIHPHSKEMGVGESAAFNDLPVSLDPLQITGDPS